MSRRPIVIVESRYAGDVARNVAYARACVRDSLNRGEAPYASHLLYTQPGILRDGVLEERALGMEAGWEFMRRADLVAVYMDLGLSDGMVGGMLRAEGLKVPIEQRWLCKGSIWVCATQEVWP